MDSRLPVNILTGFLGSGKTTLLNRLLRDPAFANSAVLINEFGEVGIDHHLVELVDGEVVLLKSGCICCTIRGDLSGALRRLYDQRERGTIPTFTRLLLETTGLADPTPVLSTIMHDAVLQHHFRAGNIIATVDAVHATGQLERYPENRKQIALADRLVLTKADLTTTESVGSLILNLRRLNPTALLIVSDREADLDADALLGQDIFRETGKIDEVGRWLRAAEHRKYFPAHRGSPNSHGDIQAFVLEPGEGIDWTAFSVWLSLVLHRHGERVLRIKGVLHIEGAETPVAIHGVQQMMHPPQHLARWPEGPRKSSVVFIVQGLDPARIKTSWRAFQRRLIDEGIAA